MFYRRRTFVIGTMKTKFFIAALLSLIFASNVLAQNTRTFSCTVTTQQFELIPNVSIEIETSSGKINAKTDAEGAFSFQTPNESISVKFFGNNIAPITRIFAATDTLVNLQIKTSFVVRPINENVTIEANTKLSAGRRKRFDSRCRTRCG